MVNIEYLPYKHSKARRNNCEKKSANYANGGSYADRIDGEFFI